MKKTLGLLGLAFTLMITSCGGGAEAPKEEGNKPMIKSSSAKTEERPADLPAVAEVVIEGNDAMKFNLDRIEVWSGQKVKLTLKHTGTMTKDQMGHSFTILKKGVDLMEFGAASAMAKDNDYLPVGREGDIVVKTKTIGGGEEVTVEFDAPEKGAYDFLCAFPGHYAMMKGKFIVK